MLAELLTDYNCWVFWYTKLARTDCTYIAFISQHFCFTWLM